MFADSGIRQAIANIPGIEPLARLEMAWKWSPNPRFTFALALSRDGRRVLQLNTLDSFDESLAYEILNFARTRDLGSSGDCRFFAPANGFQAEGYSFDTVVAVRPEVHRYYVGRNELLNEATLAVFPAYRCEVTGKETAEEAEFRFSRMLGPTLLRRDPVPYLKMRYENACTGGGSIGAKRGFTTWDVLLRELRLLGGVENGFVEGENCLGEIRRIEWRGDWVVSGGAVVERLGENDLPVWVGKFLGISISGQQGSSTA